MMRTISERLSAIIVNHELPEEVENELIYIIEDIENMEAEEAVRLTYNKNQMRFDYGV